MKWQANLGVQFFEIREDLSVGLYLYVFENGKCTHDYLQDTLEVAIECAWEDFYVPKDAWVKM